MPKLSRHARLAALSAALALVASSCREADTGGAPYATSASSGAATGGGGGDGGGGADNGGPSERLVVLNWNVHNFFNDKDDSDAESEIIVSAAQYREKRAAIAAVIQRLDPDVAVLQEVEHLGLLEDLDADLGGAYPHAALIESDDPRGIDVGALSKRPFDQVVSHREDRFPLAGTQGPLYRFARDCVELHLTLNARKVILLGVHFRSKGPPDDPDKRLAEAQRARAIADGLAAADPTAAIAVLGDFNDVTGSPPFRAVAGSGEAVFEDAATALAPSDAWTYDFNGELELIDHQMANPLLRAMRDDGAVSIPHDAMIEDASDHAPTVAAYAVTAP